MNNSTPPPRAAARTFLRPFSTGIRRLDAFTVRGLLDGRPTLGCSAAGSGKTLLAGGEITGNC